MEKKGIAVLCNTSNYTIFSYNGRKITFKTKPGLEKYTHVNDWDNGVIKVMAKYSSKERDVEEVIDIRPVLRDLDMDEEKFLEDIGSVRIGTYKSVEAHVSGYIIEISDDNNVKISNAVQTENIIFLDEEGKLLETNMEELDQRMAINSYLQYLQDLKTDKALKDYIDGKCSLGTLAMEMELSEYDLIEYLTKQKISIFKYGNIKEVLRDIENA